MAKKSPTSESHTVVIGRSAQPGEADADEMVTAVRSSVAGRLVVVDGPGAGESLAFCRGSNSIGRGPANTVTVDFGDLEIHRHAHAYLLCERGACRIGHAGQRNPVTVNGTAIEGWVEVTPADRVQIGRTTFRIELG